MATGLEFRNPSEVLSPTGIAPSLDPRLQRLLVLRRNGIPTGFAVAAELDEVPVVAKVTDADAWEQASEVRASARIGGLDPRDGTVIVTGRIPVLRVEAVRRFPFVKGLEAAVSLRPALAAGIAEAGAGAGAGDLGTGATLGNGGRGVVIGFIDYGCDFAHRNFLNAAGRTRLLAIWHQGGIISALGSVKYGREYDAAEIDAALASPDPYAALGYGPAPDSPVPPVMQGTHGTHVMDICAGGGAGSGVAGFAPEADLIFVDITPGTDLDYVRTTRLSESVQFLEALAYIFDKAGDRPCVINISLGTNEGPHDGTTLAEQGIDHLLGAAPNRAVIVAAANAYEDGIHASGALSQDAVLDLAWDVPPGAQSYKAFELWYDGRDRISAEIITPSGRSLGTIAPGTNGTVAAGGRTQVFAINRLDDPNNGDNVIEVFLEHTVEAGRWTVRLKGDLIANGAFHAWIERDDLSQSAFASPHDHASTIGSIACGHLAITVGSYDAHKPGQPLSWFSSAGPTRDGRQKPEVSGPGHDVLAAHSRTRTGVVAKSGTSMAAPAVAGIAALVLAEARARGLTLPAEEIRDILIAAARRDPPLGTDWHDRYGHGRIAAADAVAETIRRATRSGPVASDPAVEPSRS